MHNAVKVVLSRIGMSLPMLRGPLAPWVYLHRSVPPFSCRLYGTETSAPLRVLYCGSDEFSCASLRAIYDEHKRSPRSIASIDVMCRPGKPAGRGLKKIREGWLTDFIWASSTIWPQKKLLTIPSAH